MFSIPQLQGDTKACASFAITSDMEGREKIPKLSAPYLYAIVRAAEELGEVPFENNLSAQLMKFNGVSDPKKLAAKMDKGLSGRGETDALNFALQTLSQNPIPPHNDFRQGFDDFIPRDLRAIANRKYRVGKVERFDEVLPASAYREILASGQPLMVGLARDGRSEQEGWVRPEYSGTFAHLVNVVGYGREVNPLNLEEEDYFLLRDSLTDVPMHYKMSARELIPFSVTTMRVSKVIVDP
ncbi:MAG: hypothetical protein HYR96_11120 [Deltaproteobacteria bacterium]|nr:hypothetical protein [Deltaproteobacteria bacterium]